MENRDKGRRVEKKTCLLLDWLERDVLSEGILDGDLSVLVEVENIDHSGLHLSLHASLIGGGSDEGGLTEGSRQRVARDDVVDAINPLGIRKGLESGSKSSTDLFLTYEKRRKESKT